MKKYIVRAYGIVEIAMQAESIEQATELCDLNIAPPLTGTIVEIDDVIEVEEL